MLDYIYIYKDSCLSLFLDGRTEHYCRVAKGQGSKLEPASAIGTYIYEHAVLTAPRLLEASVYRASFNLI